MSIFVYFLSGSILFVFLIMACLGISFLYFYRKGIRKTPTPHNDPKVGILLPLRGSDPFLERCLIALLEQDYSNYVIRIVIDNSKDPAREVVEKVIAEKQSDKVTLEFLNDFTDTCSLRGCALRQAYQGLPDDCEIILQVDADAYPYPNWINDLASGLADPNAGIACGIRWFSPLEPNLINLMRHVWNVGAIVQMYMLNIGWGGALAIKKEAFEKANIYESWGTALFDDTYATQLILDQGYQLRVLPRVTMVNEESINLRGCITFMSRQLLNIRLYHQSWFPVFLLGLFIFLVMSVSVISSVTLLAIGETTLGLLLLGSFVFYCVGQTTLLWIAEYIVQKSQREFNKPPIKYSPLTLLLSLAFVQVIFPLCLLKARFTKDVTWRGITYDIAGPKKIKRINYEPFLPTESSKVESL